jgi:hypothetical protein
MAPALETLILKVYDAATGAAYPLPGGGDALTLYP